MARTGFSHDMARTVIDAGVDAWKPAAAGRCRIIRLNRRKSRLCLVATINRARRQTLMNDLDKIIDLVLDVWRNGAFRIDVGRLAVAMGIFIGFLTIRSLFTALSWPGWQPGVPNQDGLGRAEFASP